MNWQLVAMVAATLWPYMNEPKAANAVLAAITIAELSRKTVKEREDCE